MELSELKLISAANIIKLRTEAGMTQAELGAKLNYSDKSISKWERGEAIPDAYVLTQMAAIFNVTVDYLLSSHDAWEPPPSEDEEKRIAYNHNTIIAIVLLGIFTAALTAFVTMSRFDIIEWRVFLVALAIAVLVYLILDCVFKKARHLRYTIMGLIVTLFLNLYAFTHVAQYLILVIPALVLANLGCNMRKRPKKKHRIPAIVTRQENSEKH